MTRQAIWHGVSGNREIRLLLHSRTSIMEMDSGFKNPKAIKPQGITTREMQSFIQRTGPEL